MGRSASRRDLALDGLRSSAAARGRRRRCVRPRTFATPHRRTIASLARLLHVETRSSATLAQGQVCGERATVSRTICGGANEVSCCARTRTRVGAADGPSGGDTILPDCVPPSGRIRRIHRLGRATRMVAPGCGVRGGGSHRFDRRSPAPGSIRMAVRVRAPLRALPNIDYRRCTCSPTTTSRCSSGAMSRLLGHVGWACSMRRQCVHRISAGLGYGQMELLAARRPRRRLPPSRSCRHLPVVGCAMPSPAASGSRGCA